MKKIAITQRIMENNSYYEIRDALDFNWAQLLLQCNYLPIILPTNYPFENYIEELKIDGIIFSGGNDLYSINQNELSKKRDEFEIGILKTCMSKNIPILGICRGMQLISHYFNSKIIKKEGHIGTFHNLNACSESKYYQQINSLDKVNSFHNYCIIETTDELIPSAKSEDGVIEAIEHKHKKIFGQMWHTERNIDKKQINLIKYFFECA